MSKKKDNSEYSVEHRQEIYNRFLNLAINRFTWSNLPEGLESRDMEKFLVEYGQVMFYKHKYRGLICLPCQATSDFNIYFKPTVYHVHGHQFQDNVSIDDGVVIRNNALSTNDSADLNIFAERINEIEQTMDINLIGQRTPYVILCNEKQRLTFKNIIRQVKEFKYAIFGDSKLNMDSMTTIPTLSPYLLDKLQDHKNSIMCELLTFLGINNNNTTKQERLVVDEVNANNDFILVNIDHMFDERKKACELINEKFGLNITVEKREVEIDGTIYDDPKNNLGE